MHDELIVIIDKGSADFDDSQTIPKAFWLLSEKTRKDRTEGVQEDQGQAPS